MQAWLVGAVSCVWTEKQIASASLPHVLCCDVPAPARESCFKQEERCLAQAACCAISSTLAVLTRPWPILVKHLACKYCSTCVCAGAQHQRRHKWAGMRES